MPCAWPPYEQRQKRTLQRVAQCAEVNTGYQTRSLIFSDAETIEAAPQAHKPADSGVVVVPYARMRRLRLSGDVVLAGSLIAPTDLIASRLAQGICVDHSSTVGASLLAMDARTTRCTRKHASSLTTIASKLAPTVATRSYWISSGLTITQFLSAVTVIPSLAWAAAFLAIMPWIWVMYLSLRLTHRWMPPLATSTLWNSM